MCCLMHEGDPYGHLQFGAKGIGPAELARMVGETPPRVAKLLAELEGAGVFSRTASGVIYSRRMVRDEHIREVRAAAGSRGGNPALKDKQVAGDLLNQNAQQTGEQILTPSSSSSSSSSLLLPPSSSEGVSAQVRLTVAANQGVTAAIGEQTRPFDASHGDALALAEMITASGIDLELACRSVFTQAKRHAEKNGKRPRTLAYFTEGVRDHWADHLARVAQAGTAVPEELPVASASTRRDGRSSSSSRPNSSRRAESPPRLPSKLTNWQ